MSRILSVYMSFLVLSACSSPPKEEISLTDDPLRDNANALAKKFITTDGHLADGLIDTFNEEFPSRYSNVQKVADYIDRVVQLTGIEHVGPGPGHDRVGDSLPAGLKDVSAYPNLVFELIKRRYTEENIEKVCYKNVSMV